MAQITLRGLDPEMENEIRNAAQKSGKSLNRVILDILSRHIGFQKSNKSSPADSLKRLAGGWSEKDASNFLESIKSCEQIDEEMWK